MSNGRRGAKVQAARARLLAGRSDFACCYCAKVFPAAQATLEHIVPLGWGGSWHADNLGLACGSCNHRRNVLVTKIACVARTLQFHPHLAIGIVCDESGWHFVAPSPKAVRGAA